MPSKSASKDVENPSQRQTRSATKESKDKSNLGKRAREPSEEHLYVVEKILDKKKEKGKWLYKIKWKGYSMRDCTWEPSRHLELVKDMVAEFDRTYNSKSQNDKQDNEDAEDEDNDEPDVQDDENQEDAEEENKIDEEDKEDAGEKEEEENKDEDEENEIEQEKDDKRGKTSKEKTSTRKSPRKTPEKESKSKGKTSKDKKQEQSRALRKSFRNKAPPISAIDESDKNKKLKTDKKEVEESPSKPKQSYGHYEFGDKPANILKVIKKDDSVVFRIRWEPRDNIFTPKDTEMTNHEIRKYDKDFLLDYYETKLKFIKAGGKSSIIKSASKNAQDHLQQNENPDDNEDRGSEQHVNEQLQIRLGDGKNTAEKKIDEEVNGQEEKGEVEGEKAITLSDEKSEKIQEEISESEEDLKEVSGKIVEEKPTSIRNDGVIKQTADGQTMKALGSEDLLTTAGQSTFVDIGSNQADDIRDLTLDANMRIYSQQEQQKAAEPSHEPQELRPTDIDSPPRSPENSEPKEADAEEFDIPSPLDVESDPESPKGDDN